MGTTNIGVAMCIVAMLTRVAMELVTMETVIFLWSINLDQLRSVRIVKSGQSLRMVHFELQNPGGRDLQFLVDLSIKKGNK